MTEREREMSDRESEPMRGTVSERDTDMAAYSVCLNVRN